MIYDFLFYKAYQWGLRSKNYEDAPHWAGVIWVMPCFIFNVFTLILVLTKLTSSRGIVLSEVSKYIGAAVVIAVTFFYYLYKDRYKKIVEKYERRAKEKSWRIHPAFIVLTYYFGSFVLLLIAGMYKNGNGFWGK